MSTNENDEEARRYTASLDQLGTPTGRNFWHGSTQRPHDPPLTEMDIATINAQLHRDAEHWSTRWFLMQGEWIAVLMLGAFAVGIAAAGLAFALGAWWR